VTRSAERPASAGVLSNSRLSRVVASYGIFVLAEYATWIAITVLAFERGGATEAGLVALAQLVPAAFAAPVLGRVAEQRSPLRVRIVGHLAQAVGLTVAAIAAAGHHALLAYAGAVVTSVAVVTTRPTQAALLPGAADTPEQLTGANVALGWVENAAIAGAGLLAGVLLAVTGPWLTLACGAVLVLLAAVVVLPLRSTHGVVSAVRQAPEDSDGPAESLLRNPAAVLLLLMLTAQWLVVGSLDVLFVVLAVDVMDAGEAWVGYLQAAFGTGAFLAAAATVLLVGRRLGAPIVGFALVQVAVLAMVAATGEILVAALLLGGVGVSRAVLDVAGRTLLQRTVSPHLLGRTFGALEALSMAGRAVGSVLVPALVLLGGSDAAILGLAAVLLVGLLVGGRPLLTVDAKATVPVVEIALLRSLRLFSRLSPPALESLARSLERQEVAPGAELIREGDVGDSYLVIGTGEFEITRQGRSLGRRHRGDGVGEIALLRDVPRTATVTAATHGTVYSLAREPFLEAVTGHVPTQEAADVIVDERLRDADPAGPESDQPG
jgi:MFS family permease